MTVFSTQLEHEVFSLSLGDLADVLIRKHKDGALGT